MANTDRKRAVAFGYRPPLGFASGRVPPEIAHELRRIGDAINELVELMPQPAASEPRMPKKGLIRLAVEPWRPLGGTADRWVWWDGASWQPFGDTP